MKEKLMKCSDEELARLAAEGDSTAFEQIYDRHAGGVSRLLASFAGPDRDILDDLTQDVFVRIIDKMNTYVPSHPFAHWLYTIALNTGRNYARRQTKIILLEPKDFDAIAADDNLESRLPRDLLAETIMRHAARLPEATREVFSLRIGSDLPYSDIGVILNIPEGTARSRMHSALNALRQNLGLRQSKKETK